MIDDRPTTGGRPAGGSRVGRRVTLVALSLAVLLPVGTAVCLFPLLSGEPFDSPDAIDPAQVNWLRVNVLNRAGLDGGGDIDPFLADPADYAPLLAPLRGLTPLADKPDVVGPWLGEYRVRTPQGRRATVRLYWTKRPDTGQADVPAALCGPGVLRGRPELVPGAYVLRVQVGGKWYAGGNPMAVVSAAASAEARGTPTK